MRANFTITDISWLTVTLKGSRKGIFPTESSYICVKPDALSKARDPDNFIWSKLGSLHLWLLIYFQSMRLKIKVKLIYFRYLIFLKKRKCWMNLTKVSQFMYSCYQKLNTEKKLGAIFRGHISSPNKSLVIWKDKFLPFWNEPTLYTF